MAPNLVTWLCGDSDDQAPSGNDTSAGFNDTLLRATGAGNSTAPAAGDPGYYAGDPMLYILVVLLFYASSITLFMVKYIRKQNEERGLDDDYNAFVMRVGFDQKLMEAKNGAAMRLKEVAAGKEKPADLQGEALLVTSTV